MKDIVDRLLDIRTTHGDAKEAAKVIVDLRDQLNGSREREGIMRKALWTIYDIADKACCEPDDEFDQIADLSSKAAAGEAEAAEN